MIEDKIAEASKRVSEYKVDMSKYPMLAQTECAKKREQELAETLDRAIEALGMAKVHADDKSCDPYAWQDACAEYIDKALTELKKLRGEG